MVLKVQSGVSYLSESKARIRVISNLFLSDNSRDPPNNGYILTVTQIIKSAISSAVEAKLGALYINFRKAIPARHTLIAMIHPQPPTPV